MLLTNKFMSNGFSEMVQNNVDNAVNYAKDPVMQNKKFS